MKEYKVRKGKSGFDNESQSMLGVGSRSASVLFDRNEDLTERGAFSELVMISWLVEV